MKRVVKIAIGVIVLPFVAVVSFVLYLVNGDFVEPVKVGV